MGMPSERRAFMCRIDGLEPLRSISACVVVRYVKLSVSS